MPDYQKSSQKDEGVTGQPDKPRPEVHKIVTGEVVIPKKTLGEKFAATFFDGAFFKGLVNHVYKDVIVPNAKHILFDTGLEILKGGIYRNGNARRILDPQNLVSRFSYQTPPSRPGYPSSGYPMTQTPQFAPPRPVAEIGPQRVPSYDGRRLYRVTVRKEAEKVLEAMTDIIDSDYKVVSVGEVHEMLGLEWAHPDNGWGWFSIGNARIIADREGYILDLPPPEAL